MDRKNCQIYLFKNKTDLKNNTLLLQLLEAEVGTPARSLNACRFAQCTKLEFLNKRG